MLVGTAFYCCVIMILINKTVLQEKWFIELYYIIIITTQYSEPNILCFTIVIFCDNINRNDVMLSVKIPSKNGFYKIRNSY